MVFSTWLSRGSGSSHCNPLRWGQLHLRNLRPGPGSPGRTEWTAESWRKINTGQCRWFTICLHHNGRWNFAGGQRRLDQVLHPAAGSAQRLRSLWCQWTESTRAIGTQKAVLVGLDFFGNRTKNVKFLLFRFKSKNNVSKTLWRRNDMSNSAHLLEISNKHSIYSRMRCQGSRFTLGAWGWGGVRSALRWRPHPSATVRNRSSRTVPQSAPQKYSNVKKACPTRVLFIDVRNMHAINIGVSIRVCVLHLVLLLMSCFFGFTWCARLDLKARYFMNLYPSTHQIRQFPSSFPGFWDFFLGLWTSFATKSTGPAVLLEVAATDPAAEDLWRPGSRLPGAPVEGSFIQKGHGDTKHSKTQKKHGDWHVSISKKSYGDRHWSMKTWLSAILGRTQLHRAIAWQWGTDEEWLAVWLFLK